MTYSPALPAAMGYSVTLPLAMNYIVSIDESAGYGVTRVLVSHDLLNGSDEKVWNPRDDSAQCFEVLAWMLRSPGCSNYCTHMVKRDFVGEYNDEATDHFRICGFKHNNTPASLRAAIVEAAERVAQS